MMNSDFGSQVPSTIERGVLSLRSANAIGKHLEGVQLSSDDVSVLGRASSFLSLIIAGASLVSRRHSMHGFSASESIEALDQALTPFDVLQDIVSDKDVVDFFQHLQQSIDKLVEGKADEQYRETLGFAQRFFDALDQSIRASLATELMPLSKQQTQPPMLAFA